MIKIREAIVVEGRYDKAALAGLVDTVILDTAGFGIFSDKEKLDLLRRLAQARGLVVLTDSDGGGFVIRNFLKSAIDPALVKHAYIPDVYGKERRKKSPSKEGKLGVEGMKPEVLLEALRRADVTIEGEETPPRSEMPITKAELYALGLTGRPDSAARRAYVLQRLSLPERLTTNAMLDVFNVLVTRQELTDIISEI
jgi:ribonuclease M5